MATGRLGASDLSATSNTTVYTVTTSMVGSITVNICNRNSNSVSIRLALSTSDSPGSSEWIEYDTLIPANSILERSGVVLDAGKKVVAYASTTGVSVVVWGYEEAA